MCWTPYTKTNINNVNKTYLINNRQLPLVITFSYDFKLATHHC